MDQQDRCEVSRTSLVTSRTALKSLGRVWGPAGWPGVSRKSLGDQQDSCEVSKKSLGASRMAMKSLGRVLGSAE